MEKELNGTAITDADGTVNFYEAPTYSVKDQLVGSAIAVGTTLICGVVATAATAGVATLYEKWSDGKADRDHKRAIKKAEKALAKNLKNKDKED